MNPDRFVILADESANWEIAGLRQLDRLALALNEFAAGRERARTIEVAVFWNPASAMAGRWLPNESRLHHLRLTEADSPPPASWLLSTRWLVHRDALTSSLPALSQTPIAAQNWQQLAERFENKCSSARQGQWQFLHSVEDIAAAEAALLHRTGKPQDGIVSRWINRPLTKPLTRVLLKLPITPTEWTLSIFILPVLTAAFLFRGDYVSVLIGTLIYQLYSMLDGCDGEIARAKYLESPRGGRVDDLCDLAGAFMFVISLGLGLWRSHAPAPFAWLYAAEGASLAAFIAVNEWGLRRSAHEPSLATTELAQAAYPRHRRMIERAGLSRLGETLVWCVLQATKRDVGILAFVLLALCDLPRWILHPWLVVTLMTLGLNAVSRRPARA